MDRKNFEIKLLIQLKKETKLNAETFKKYFLTSTFSCNL